MKLDITKTIVAIKTELKKLQKEDAGRKDWTGLIKKAFIEIGAAKDYKVCTSLSEDVKCSLTGTERDSVVWGEWLYDLVWYTESQGEVHGEKLTISVPLVMECEWGVGIPNMALDFNKLLVANADLRVMVCGAYDKETTDNFIAYCERAVQSYQQGHIGDCFLLCLMPNEGKVIFRTIVKYEHLRG